MNIGFICRRRNKHDQQAETPHGTFRAAGLENSNFVERQDDFV